MPPARRLQFPSGRPLPAGRALIVGHRGARAFAPENTLAAFEKAAALGCDMVELDVHLSRDGVPVVHHDDRLGRCTDVAIQFPLFAGEFISDFTLEELRVLDAGTWYAHELDLPAERRQAYLRDLTDAELDGHVPAGERERYASGAIRIPTLQEVLALVAEADLMLNVEIKSIPRLYGGIAARVVDEVRAAGLQSSVLVSSFDHEQLVEVRRLDAGIATGVLTSGRLARIADYLALLDADAYHPCCHGEADSLGFDSVHGALDTAAIAALAAAGRMVFVWTCNDAHRMSALDAAGVTGIITDYPNRAAAMRRARHDFPALRWN
ncbi:glycerophosphodiester phosphodiesterase [Thauera sinica]|uniref:Glycerophosphodiester phosphodiesterase n=1 Tax=Thauera sinica TaxID=2665146 RepID=A0ABW1ANV9_9RHOO|nr:glycerophosphodiester phosphodiesterase family protein [Thauera sp. K11]ATE61616.1 glycerophosphodiester phosphodiesterase [Thauera sp. K11]